MAISTAGLVVGTSHWVSSDGYRLHVWEKRRETARAKGPAPTRVTLLVHGGTYCGPTDYDVQAPGKDYSLMDYLAVRGHDVFTFDIRGYGRSEKPEDGYSVTTEVAVRDTAAVVEAICKMRGVTSLDLFGWSWGTAVSGIYTSRNPARVRRLLMYAGATQPSPAPPAAPGGLDDGQPWFVTTRESITARVDQAFAIPEALEAFIQAALRWDAKSPNGVRRRLPGGGPRWRMAPEEITVPTLMVYGERDSIYRPKEAADFFARLKTPDKTLIVIPNADHFLIIEKPYKRLFTATEQWFGD